jgi:hypothetical protein
LTVKQDEFTICTLNHVKENMPVMSYEVFNRKIRIVTPAITLHTSGRIYLNQGASSHLLSNAAKRVLLLWDKEHLKLAIKPLNKKDNRAYSIAYSHKGSGATLTAKGFFEWIGYDSEPGTLTLSAEWNVSEGMFEVKIPSEKIKGAEKKKPRMVSK